MLISVGPSVRQLRAWLESADSGFDTLSDEAAIENARQELRWSLAYLSVLDDVQDALAVLPDVERRVFGEALPRSPEVLNLGHCEIALDLLPERVARTDLYPVNDNVRVFRFADQVGREGAVFSAIVERHDGLSFDGAAKRSFGGEVARRRGFESLRRFWAGCRKWVNRLSDHRTSPL